MEISARNTDTRSRHLRIDNKNMGIKNGGTMFARKQKQKRRKPEKMDRDPKYEV